MLRPTFAGFQVAKRGLSASQKLLDVTGQNITNINTDGYTRQRVDLYSIAHSSGMDKFSMHGGQIGRGVGDLGPSQIRDPFLDIRYRNEAAKVGREEVLGDAIADLEEIFGEISKKGLDSQFSNMISQLQALSATPSDPVIEGVVKTAASMITQLFNHYSKQLETVREQQTTYLEDSVNVTNRLMSEISELNKQIRSQNIHGDKALELNDRRNSLIDELSTYMNIEVIRGVEKIGSDREIETLSIHSKDIMVQPADGSPVRGLILVSGKDYSKIELQKPNPLVDPSDYKDMKIKFADTIDAGDIVLSIGPPPTLGPTLADDLNITQYIERGQISGYLAFLNNKGEFTNNTNFTTKDRGIQYYEGMLDKLANTFATMFNNANRKANYDASGTLTGYTDRDLFAATGGGKITASNIKISDAWRDNTKSYITNTNKPPVFDDAGNPVDTSAANDNIFNIISQFNKKVEFKHVWPEPPAAPTVQNFLFEGTLQEMFSYTSSTVDLQIANTQSLYDGYGQTLLAIDTSRQSISGVSLDEEGINLLTYNKSYAAAARLMTTLDEAIDILINRTGRVGL